MADALDKAIRLKGLTRDEAAAELGLGKSGLQNYIAAEDAPRSDYFFKALYKWGAVFQYQGWIVRAERADGASKASYESQMNLFERLEDENLDVTILKKSSKSVDLQVRIKMSR